MDDFFFAQNFSEYLDSLERLMVGFKEKKIGLNVNKCFTLRIEVQWCGREVYRYLWKFPMKLFDKILKANRPTYVHELAQMLYVSN